MTTTEDVTVLHQLAAETLLDQRVEVCHHDTANLNDIAALLGQLGRSTLHGAVDPIRTSGILAVAVAALSRFDTPTRTAPPADLNAAVSEYGQACGWEECDGRVYEWDDDGTFCSPACRSAVAE